ncbi:hypothetical protein L8106_04906 [Lyngbya sp. PCC 8106]|nr:hypothetical protein L8106_04906 [Lyngbya sp. PCC 8106]
MSEEMGRWGGGEVGRWGVAIPLGEIGRWGGGETVLTSDLTTSETALGLVRE